MMENSCSACKSEADARLSNPSEAKACKGSSDMCNSVEGAAHGMKRRAEQERKLILLRQAHSHSLVLTDNG